MQELADRTAAAAALQPYVRPGEWVYRNEKAALGDSHWTFQLWSTPDATNVAYFENGRLTFDCGVPGHSGAGSCGNQALSGAVVLPHVSAGMIGLTQYPPYGNILVKYAVLGFLPRGPKALDRYLGTLDQSWLGTAAAREFFIIEEMLGSYVMPPGLTSELYLALGDIPGVTVDRHAVDAAGRNGIGFKLGAAAWGEEIIVSSRTYQLMGQQVIGGSAAHPQLYGTPECSPRHASSASRRRPSRPDDGSAGGRLSRAGS